MADGPTASHTVTGSMVGIACTLHERVLDWMRQAIADGTLQPGERIVQTEIAERLGVSPTPVREAMRDLHAEGLIRLDPRRVATVQSANLDDVREVRTLRSNLEALCARLVVERITPEELAYAEKLQEEMETNPDHSTYLELNRRFHMFLYETARSPRLTAMLMSLRAAMPGTLSISFLRRTERRADGLEEHRRFLKACHDKDVEAAALSAVDHLRASFDEAEAMATPAKGGNHRAP